MKLYKTILLGFLFVLLGSCEKENAIENNYNPEDKGWVLVWSDEFDMQLIKVKGV